MRTLLLLPLFACAKPTLSVTGNDEFGEFGDVVEAYWTTSDTVDLFVFAGGAVEDIGSAAFDQGLRFFNEDVGCGDYQDQTQAWADASSDLLDASSDGADLDAFCAAMPEYLLALADANAGLPVADRRFTVGLCVGDTCDDVLPEGTWAPGSTDEVYLNGTLAYQPEDPSEAYEAAAADWDVDACLAGAAPSPTDPSYWYASAGEVQIDKSGRGGIDGSLELELVDEAGEPAGVISGEFELPRCEGPDVERVLLF